MARKRTGKGSGPHRQEAGAGPGKGQRPDAPANGSAQAGGTSRTPAIPAGGSSGRGLGQRPRPASTTAAKSRSARPSQQVIPDAVANRMARRIAIATGIPTVMGMGVFIGSYLVVSRGIADIPPGATLVASGACFLLGLVGLSYGVLSSSWEDAPGSLLGQEQIGVNIKRVRDSIRAMRQGASGGSQG